MQKELKERIFSRDAKIERLLKGVLNYRKTISKKLEWKKVDINIILKDSTVDLLIAILLQHQTVIEQNNEIIRLLENVKRRGEK